MKSASPEAFRLLLSALDSRAGQRPDEPIRNARHGVLRDATELARANGVEYPFLAAMANGPVPLEGVVNRRWSLLRESHARFLRTLSFLNEVSSRSGVDYALIKDCSTVDHVPRDVDILVRDVDRGRFLSAVRSEGLALLYDDGGETSVERPDLMRIDVYSRICYVGRDFLEDSFLWSSRQISSAYGIPHPTLKPEASYLLNLIHGLLGHGGVTLLDLLDLSSLRGLMQNPGLCRDQAQASGWVGVYDLLEERMRRLRKAIYNPEHPALLPHRYPRRFVMECVSHLTPSFDSRKARISLRLSLIFDEIVFSLEEAGLAEGLRRVPIGPRIGNSLGHRVRLMRGDRKHLAATAASRAGRGRG